MLVTGDDDGKWSGDEGKRRDGGDDTWVMCW